MCFVDTGTVAVVRKEQHRFVLTQHKSCAKNLRTFSFPENPILRFLNSNTYALPLDEDKDHRDETKFFEVLGSRGDIKDANEGGDDVAFEKNNQASVTLYRCVLPWKCLLLNLLHDQRFSKNRKRSMLLLYCC